MAVITLQRGVRRKLFVDRKAAARLEPPIVVEEPNGTRYYARNIEGWSRDSNWPEPTFEFKWSGNNEDAPVLWIETEAELELID